MPQYELEDSKHAEIDSAEDPALESDSDLSTDAEEATPEDTSEEEVSGEEEGTPEEGEEEAEEDQETDGEEEGEADSSEIDELIPDIAAADPGAFEIGGVTLKAGEKLTPKQVASIKNEMERSYFRESDYTRKCQEIGPIRDRANDVLQNFNNVIANEHANPSLLFQHITPEHAIRALASIGFDIDPALLQTIGYGNSYRNYQPQGGPNPQNPQPQNGFEKEFRDWRQKEDQTALTRQLDQEVRSEIADIKNPQLHQELYESILVKAALFPDKTIKQIATMVRQDKRERFSKLITAKKGGRKGKIVARGSGSSRAVQHQGPQTWEDADRSARGRINAMRR